MNADESDLEHILTEVAHLLYADAYAYILVERGEPLPPGTRIEHAVPRDGRAVPLLRSLIGRIEVVWKTPIANVFAAMGLTKDEDMKHALFHLVFGCIGHGVSLDDDFEAERKRAEAVLGRELKPVPIREEGQEFWEIADETIQRKGVIKLPD